MTTVCANAVRRGRLAQCMLSVCMSGCCLIDCQEGRGDRETHHAGHAGQVVEVGHLAEQERLGFQRGEFLPWSTRRARAGRVGSGRAERGGRRSCKVGWRYGRKSAVRRRWHAAARP